MRKNGLFNDEYYEDSSILVSCEVMRMADIKSMELFEEQIQICLTVLHRTSEIDLNLTNSYNII